MGYYLGYGNGQCVGGYTSYAPYAQVEQDLINAGFDVLVFVPSMDEENNLVTCGNAILGGSTFKNHEVNNKKGDKNEYPVTFVK